MMEGRWERRRERPQDPLKQMSLRNHTYGGCGSELGVAKICPCQESLGTGQWPLTPSVNNTASHPTVQPRLHCRDMRVGILHAPPRAQGQASLSWAGTLFVAGKSSGPFQLQCWLRADRWWEPAGPVVPLLPYLPTYPRQRQRWIVTHFSTELTRGLRILLNTTSGHCLNLSHLGLWFLQVTWTNPPRRPTSPAEATEWTLPRKPCTEKKILTWNDPDIMTCSGW